jgi:anti-sigma B factor antagonist
MDILTSSQENGVVLIEIEGDIDAHTAPQLERTLNDLVAQGHNRLVLDVSQVDFISSAGLRAITFANRDVSQRGGQVRLCRLNAQTRRIFELAALDEWLKIYNTRQEAMEGW